MARSTGLQFTLTEHDNAALNRDWQLVTVVHDGQQPQTLEEDAVGSDSLQGRAGLEAMTLDAGGSFLTLDGSGVALAGPSVKLNTGGSLGSGSGQSALMPLLPARATPETHSAMAPLEQAGATPHSELTLHKGHSNGEGAPS